MALIVAAFARPFFKVDPVAAAARPRARATSSSCSTDPPAWATAITGRAPRTRRARSSRGSSGDDRATLVLFDERPRGGRARHVRPRGARGGHRPGDRVVRRDALRARPAAGAEPAEHVGPRPTGGVPRSATSRRPAGSARRRSTCPKAPRSRRSRWPSWRRRTWRSPRSRWPARVVFRRGAGHDHGRRWSIAAARRSTKQPVQLEIDGRVVAQSRRDGRRRTRTGSVTFDAVTVSETNIRGGDPRRAPTRCRRTTTSTSCCRRAAPCRCSCSRTMRPTGVRASISRPCWA